MRFGHSIPLSTLVEHLIPWSPSLHLLPGQWNLVAPGMAIDNRLCPGIIEIADQIWLLKVPPASSCFEPGTIEIIALSISTHTTHTRVIRLNGSWERAWSIWSSVTFLTRTCTVDNSFSLCNRTRVELSESEEVNVLRYSDRIGLVALWKIFFAASSNWLLVRLLETGFVVSSSNFFVPLKSAMEVFGVRSAGDVSAVTCSDIVYSRKSVKRNWFSFSNQSEIPLLQYLETCCCLF